jgi:hypothetical protein
LYNIPTDPVIVAVREYIYKHATNRIVTDLIDLLRRFDREMSKLRNFLSSQIIFRLCNEVKIAEETAKVFNSEVNNSTTFSIDSISKQCYAQRRLVSQLNRNADFLSDQATSLQFLADTLLDTAKAYLERAEQLVAASDDEERELQMIVDEALAATKSDPIEKKTTRLHKKAKSGSPLKAGLAENQSARTGDKVEQAI